jgi:hypothetical protein
MVNVGLGGLRCPVTPLLGERRERLEPRRFPDQLRQPVVDRRIGAGDLTPVRKGDDDIEHVSRPGRPVRGILREPGAALEQNGPTTRGCERVEFHVAHSPHPVGMQPVRRDRRLRQTFPAHRLDRVPPDLGHAAGDAHPVGEFTLTGAPARRLN